jgi:activator of 2-hydroxyglutaryl-CoA dehydratase
MATRRVNLRIDEETYLAFEKVAVELNQSVAGLIRESCVSAMPTMRNFSKMIDQAKAGDAQAAQQVFQMMLTGYSRQIVEVGETVDTIFRDGAETSVESAGASNTAL